MTTQRRRRRKEDTSTETTPTYSQPSLKVYFGLQTRPNKSPSEPESSDRTNKRLKPNKRPNESESSDRANKRLKPNKRPNKSESSDRANKSLKPNKRPNESKSNDRANKRLKPNKMPNESESSERANRRFAVCVNIANGEGVGNIYNFRLLMPNGTSLGLKIRHPNDEMLIEEFVENVKEEYLRTMKQSESQTLKRPIDWQSKKLYFVDAFDMKITKTIDFRKFAPKKCHILRLHDGSGEVDTYENMWDLTPHTDLLMELPEEYTFETALADLIDNSLQAVWSNGVHTRKLISVEIAKDKISIFDTGSGMGGSNENSIDKWGKMGASLHRSSRGKAIGGKPPFLTPFFGMFGYGGTIASMHLGRHTMVSSKTKDSKNVYTLHLKREALLNSSVSEQRWRADGGIRLPVEDEIQKSPHGTFTKVEIFEPKMKSLDILQLQCKLKDIYFPYIQCDEVSNTGKTVTPIEFQVNGNDLAEIEGGEVAITNLNSCNGPNFVLQLRFHLNQDLVATSSPGARASGEANARLKCVYFPVVEGKERIERILDKLEAEGNGVMEKFESFSRVSIRRLGRLLPDARWSGLPFMEPKQRVGEKARALKRCRLRVKCFIETDAGFNPTPSKTDLAHRHPYTTALRNFGNVPKEREKEVNIEIYSDGKPLTLSQLEKKYQEWIDQMHGLYDEETVSGEDVPVIVVLSPSHKQILGISLEVGRVHKVIRRKGTSWKSGQKIKVLKGACTGCHNKNVYATLEYILIEGLPGDSGVGEARLICRQLGVPDNNGCTLAKDNGNPRLDVRDSMCLPISVIDSGKCLAIETSEWNYQLQKHRQKIPSTIDILTAKHCQQLEVEGALPTDGITVYAGHAPPKKIVAVVRPASFSSATASKLLDQKYIVKDSLEMAIEVKLRSEDKNPQAVDHIYSGCVKPSSLKGIDGFYIFTLGSKCRNIFQKVGDYKFSFSLRGSKICEKRVQVKVKASSEVGSWGLLSEEQSEKHSVRVGSCFPPLSIACYDRYKNRIPFPFVPKVMVKIGTDCDVLGHVQQLKVDLSSTKMILKIKDMLIESNELDKIRPSYRTTLLISPRDKSCSVAIPCEVSPGSLHQVIVQGPNLEKQLLPWQIIKELVLEMFDAYGNHVRGGAEVQLDLVGLGFQDQMGVCKVDQDGRVDLSGLLRVTGGYGKNVSLCVLSNQSVVFKKEYQTEIRELRVACKVPECCAAGSKLENVVFEVIDSKGDLDVTIHDEENYGLTQTLTIKSDSLDTDDSVRYSFQHGRCVVRAITLPDREGTFSLEATHSRYPELKTSLKVHIEPAQKADHGGVKTPYSNGNVLLLQDPFVHKTPKLEHNVVHHQFLDGNMLFQTPEQVGNLAESIINKQQEHDKVTFSMVQHIEQLNDRQTAIRQEMAQLQGSMETDLVQNSDYSLQKELITERIGSKENSAAAVVCRLFRELHQEQQNQLTRNVLGVVALLGIVQTTELSRILSEYLGEDQMLAVVCTNYAAADALERYEQNGKVDHAHALRAAATGLGISISGRYLVICAEDTRPYTGDITSDPQRKLALADPTQPSGGIPTGYLGYAVNMIDLDVKHLCTRTASGHGLRETLFYCLFGELQVYETRDDMKKAIAYIKQGAVSLDGGIFRGNGVISLGYGEPHIHFPVSSMHFSPQNMEIMKQIQEKKSELKEIEKETKTCNTMLKKIKKGKEKYTKFLDKMTPLSKSLDYSPY